MSEFEDPQLKERLQRLAGPAADDEVAYVRLQQGVRIAKRRRLVAVGAGIGAACLIAVGSLALVGRGQDRLSPADGGVDDPEFTVVEPTVITEDSAVSTVTTLATVTTIGVASTTSSMPSTEAPDSTAIPAPTVTVPTTAVRPSMPEKPAPVPTTPPTSAAKPPQTSPTTSPSSVASVPPAEPPTTSAGPPPANIGPTTYSSDGGAITVRVTNGRLELVGHNAAAGFTAEVETNDGVRVKVRFESDSKTTRIEVRLANGTLIPNIDNGSSEPHDSTPDTGSDPGSGKDAGSGGTDDSSNVGSS